MPCTTPKAILSFVLLLSSAVVSAAEDPAPPASELDAAVGEYVHRLPEVVVEGTYWEGLPVVPVDEPRSHDVLSPRRIQDATVTTYEGVVKRLPGVSSRLYSGDEYVRPSISLRGMPDNGFTEYTAVLVDEINMSTLFYGWTAISIFPFTPERIYAAEVIRGGHAVRYGPNTIGGIVNVITTPIPDGLSFNQRLVFGSHSYHSSLTEFGGRLPGHEEFGALLTFVEKGGDTFRDHNRFDINEFAMKGVWDIDESTRLNVSAFHWRDIHNIPGRLTKAQLDKDPDQNPNPDWVDWHGWSYGGTFNLHRRITTEDWIQWYGYYRLARRALDSPRPTNPPFTAERSADSDNQNFGTGVEGEAAVEAGVRNVLHYGLRLHSEEIERITFDSPIAPGGSSAVTSDSSSTNNAIAGNIDDTIRFGDFTLNAGVRLEWMPSSRAHDNVSGNRRDFDYFEALPGASLSYLIAENAAVFANMHRSFRPPQTWSYDFANRKQDLDFETGRNTEVGLRTENLDGLSGSVALWQIEYSDFIDFDPDTEVYTNLGGYRSRGIDFTFDLDAGRTFDVLDGVGAFGTVTYQGSEFTKGPNDGRNTPFVPSLIVQGGIRYEHESGIYGVLEGTYHGESDVDAANKYTTPGNTVFDLRLGWRHEIDLGKALLRVDLAGAVKNLFDADVWLRHNATLYVPGAPRELFASLGFGLDF